MHKKWMSEERALFQLRLPSSLMIDVRHIGIDIGKNQSETVEYLLTLGLCTYNTLKREHEVRVTTGEPPQEEAQG